jgi:glucose/arabinose dehydrogenase
MNTMIRKLIQCAAAVLAAALLVAACGGNDDDRAPTVTTYATGLTSPRGLAFGPDGRLYVAEAGTGGALAPAGTADCPSQVNIYSPYTAGYTGRVVQVLADGTKQTIVDKLPSMTDAYGGNYGRFASSVGIRFTHATLLPTLLARRSTSERRVTR